MADLAEPARALADVLGDWDPEKIVLCGMAGARNGLREAPYTLCPAGLEGWRSHAIEFAIDGRRVAIAPGVAWAKGPDVMRGEETQVFGAIARRPALGRGRHLLVLPGTHSKWVRLVDGRIESFRTFMTGELFELLQRSSLSVAGDRGGRADSEGGFAEGLARGGSVSSSLFEARSGQLIGGKSAAWAVGFISGVLIGAELSEMDPAGSVTVVAESELAERYRLALAGRGVEAVMLDAEECAIAGLKLLDADA